MCLTVASRPMRRRCDDACTEPVGPVLHGDDGQVRALVGDDLDRLGERGVTDVVDDDDGLRQRLGVHEQVRRARLERGLVRAGPSTPSMRIDVTAEATASLRDRHDGRARERGPRDGGGPVAGLAGRPSRASSRSTIST